MLVIGNYYKITYYNLAGVLSIFWEFVMNNIFNIIISIYHIQIYESTLFCDFFDFFFGN